MTKSLFPIKSNKILVNLIVVITAIFLLGCADNTAASTQAIITPTKISTSTKTPFPTPFPQVSVGTVLTTTLNLRRGPGTEYSVRGSKQLGDEFYILADGRDTANRIWFCIPTSKDSFGWIIGEAHLVNRKLVNIDSFRNKSIIDLYGVSMYTLILDYAKQKKTMCGSTPPETSIQQSIPTVKPQSKPVAVCTCSNNAYNCNNFSSQSAAQSCYNYCQLTVGFDVHWLDEDGDGIACEWNP